MTGEQIKKERRYLVRVVNPQGEVIHTRRFNSTDDMYKCFASNIDYCIVHEYDFKVEEVED